MQANDQIPIIKTSFNGPHWEAGEEVTVNEVTLQTTELPNAGETARIIIHVAHRIIEKTALGSPNAGRVVLLDIPSGGVPLAEKLTDLIERFSGIRPETGSFDITLYRDDLCKGPHRTLQPTNIPNSEVDGTTVVLVNDVLFSGRTIRAALDTIADIGHLRVTQLAVLVDHGHHQLPIHVNYIGKNLLTSRDKDVDVLVEVLDGRGMVILTRAGEQ